MLNLFWLLALTTLIAVVALRTAAVLKGRLGKQADVLKRSEALFRNTLENLPLFVVGLDVNGLVTFCNQALVSTLGLKKEKVIGKPWHGRFVSPNCADDETPLLLDSSLVHLRCRHENYLLTGTADRRFVSWYNTLLHDTSGAFTGTVSVGEDITKRKQLQEELTRASEAAAAASRSKSEFLANMSHEIRTPMNGIVGMTDLVLESELTVDQRENLLLVKASADSLLTIINDILDFSKIEAGKLSFEPIPFNLEDAVWESLKSVAMGAHAKGIELTCVVDEKVPLELVGDPGRLRQVLLNLLSNALKFTEHGEVGLRIGLESETKEQALLHFCVFDTGIGMSEAQQRKIFHAFTQAEVSIARQFGGTGLGLSICARLVQMFGGRIWVESAPGEGSRFHFTCPFSLAQRVETKIDICLPDKMRALVLDDHSATRQMLLETLQTCGVESASAANGRTAIEQIQAAIQAGEPYDLLIVDFNISDMDGFEVVRLLRALPDAAAIKAILLTSVGQRGDAAVCKELGIQAYLRKPLKPSELRQCIWKLMQTPGAPEPSLVTRHSLREDRMRILLAEDGLVNQRLAVKLLEKRGHLVVVANNGQEAVNCFDDGPFDIVLMDIEMPVMNGFEAAQIIRAREQNSRHRTRIIAMTAHAMQGDREKCLTAGMDDYISKPIRAEELYALLAA